MKKLQNLISLRLVGLVAAIICLTASIFVSFTGSFDDFEKEMTKYPLEYSISTYNPYMQQFDAFHKHQLHLDVIPDERLSNLDNPYSPEEREGIDYLWDRAYYNGRYYSYFGIAPIIIFYEPFYILTGKLPTTATAIGFFAAIASIFLPLTISNTAEIISKKSSKVLTFILALIAPSCSLLFLIQRGVSRFYYLATVSALAFTGLFLFLLTSAFTAKKRFVRTALFILSGISYSLIFLSRFNQAILPGMAALLFVIKLIIEKQKEGKLASAFVNCAFLAFPVLCAVVFTLIYNSLRFGSPFEFGTTYQLTVADVSTYRLSAKAFLPAICHYFLQPFLIVSDFPFLRFKSDFIIPDEPAFYIDQCIGVFSHPFIILFLLAPFAAAKKKTLPFERAILATLFIFPVLLAFIDYCFGGVIFRYTADFAFFCFLCAAVTVLIISRDCKNAFSKGFLMSTVCWLSLTTAVISFLTVFMKSGNLSEVNPDILQKVSEILCLQ
ncbi:MAG: hypothetical protein K6B52_04330 [Clostridiales bacterium]|nr:hypothetical protein [Clostridiales bacterium]